MSKKREVTEVSYTGQRYTKTIVERDAGDVIVDTAVATVVGAIAGFAICPPLCGITVPIGAAVGFITGLTNDEGD